MRLINRDKTFILFMKLMVVFILNSVVGYAQNFERFSNKEGFNQNTITSIEQDKYGFLWYGTPNGLIKYDGYDFETYTTQSQTSGNISSNNLTSILLRLFNYFKSFEIIICSLAFWE